MEKKIFVIHLLPPRPNFAQSMTEEERNIMQRHSAYWRDLMAKGTVIVFGPVMHPNGFYGLGIVEVDSEDDLKTFMANDPANSLSRYEYFPMRAVLPRDLV
jgi:uncharacterized protein